MRQIKCRAYNVTDPNVRIEFTLEEAMSWHPCEGVYSDTWQIVEYTGLKDKNGREIYEGDIVSGVLYKDYSEHIGRVLFDYNGYRIVTSDKSVELCLTDILEVIGNIYENPELIQKEG